GEDEYLPRVPRPRCHPRESGDLCWLWLVLQTEIPALAGMTRWGCWLRCSRPPPPPLRRPPPPLHGGGSLTAISRLWPAPPTGCAGPPSPEGREGLRGWGTMVASPSSARSAGEGGPAVGWWVGDHAKHGGWASWLRCPRPPPPP